MGRTTPLFQFIKGLHTFWLSPESSRYSPHLSVAMRTCITPLLHSEEKDARTNDLFSQKRVMFQHLQTRRHDK
jgi:hypothetical protein